MSGTVQDWLRTKNVAIWPPQQWDLTDDEELEQAASWFSDQLTRYEAFWRSQAFVSYDVKRIVDGPVVPGSLKPLPPPRPEDLQPFTGKPCPCRRAGYGETCHTGQSWNEHRQEMVRATQWAHEHRENR